MVNVFMKYGGLGKIISIPDDVLADMDVLIEHVQNHDDGIASRTEDASARLEIFLRDIRKKELEDNWISDTIGNLTTEQEDKLKEIHAKDYHGTDDDMPDAYESWIENLTVDELKAALV